MSRAGFSLIEVAIVALIAGGAMIYLLSLGQASQQMSRVSQESLLARQVAMDVLEYYARNLTEARQRSRPAAQPEDFYLRHAAFRGALGVSEQTDSLYLRMAPKVTLQMQPNVEFPAGSSRFHTGLHRLDCTVTWTKGGAAGGAGSLTVSRLAAETP